MARNSQRKGVIDVPIHIRNAQLRFVNTRFNGHDSVFRASVNTVARIVLAMAGRAAEEAALQSAPCLF
jgi:hypothetical protein